MELADALDKHFPRYRDHDPAVPIWIVTPGEGRTTHRFFDSSPISPSGRFLGVFRLPVEDRQGEPGERGQVVVVDLHTGTETVVAESAGWDTQLGAQVQWGADDTELFFGDVDTTTWRPFGVVLDPATGKRRTLEAPCYHVRGDGRAGVTVDLAAIRRTQGGYGVLVPDEAAPVHEGFPDDDGLYLVDTASGEARLIFSLRDALGVLEPHLEADPASVQAYGFHAKWNRQGDRLFFVVRWHPAEGAQAWSNHNRPGNRSAGLTLRPDGTDAHVAIPPAQWRKGGHHPNWFPDGETLSMNLNLAGEGMRFVRVGHDGADLREMVPGITGSGHPTVHPDGRHVLTDAYPWESLADADGTAPLRWVDLEAGTEQVLARLPLAATGEGDVVLRVDAHPAWDRTHRYATINVNLDGTRRVMIADLAPVLTP